jgi:hypothetical protein
VQLLGLTFIDFPPDILFKLMQQEAEEAYTYGDADGLFILMWKRGSEWRASAAYKDYGYDSAIGGPIPEGVVLRAVQRLKNDGKMPVEEFEALCAQADVKKLFAGFGWASGGKC